MMCCARVRRALDEIDGGSACRPPEACGALALNERHVKFAQRARGGGRSRRS
jgi:hypothetical protein